MGSLSPRKLKFYRKNKNFGSVTEFNLEDQGKKILDDNQ